MLNEEKAYLHRLQDVAEAVNEPFEKIYEMAIAFYKENKKGDLEVMQALETFKEIPSDDGNFDERPWMKSADITDAVIEAIKSEKYDFIRCNFPNGDMVGYTGNYDATITGVEAVDLGLARLKKVCD